MVLMQKARLGVVSKSTCTIAAGERTSDVIASTEIPDPITSASEKGTDSELFSGISRDLDT
jgi:hypothetical protein